VLGQAPWAPDAAEQRVSELRDFILAAMARPSELPAGLSAYAAPIAADAQCIH
jgi:hypothetical protein